MEAHKQGFDSIDFAFYLSAVCPFMSQGPLQWDVLGVGWQRHDKDDSKDVKEVE